MRAQKTRWRTSGQSKGRVANQGTVPGLQDWFRTSRKGFPESQRARSVFLLGLQDTTGDENKMMPTRNFSRTRHMEVRRRVSAVLSRCMKGTETCISCQYWMYMYILFTVLNIKLNIHSTLCV